MRYLLVLALLTFHAQALTLSFGNCDDQTISFAHAAVAAWNTALDGALDSDTRIIPVTVTNMIYPALGETGSNGVLLAPFPSASVVMHEIGHALGLQHSADPDSIMYPMPGAFAVLNQTDVTAIREVFGLSPKSLLMRVKITRHKVTIRGQSRLDACYWGDGTNSSGRRLVHRFPSGVYSLRLYSGVFLIQQTITMP